jgi:hypothetical protein
LPRLLVVEAQVGQPSHVSDRVTSSRSTRPTERVFANALRAEVCTSITEPLARLLQGGFAIRLFYKGGVVGLPTVLSADSCQQDQARSGR